MTIEFIKPTRWLNLEKVTELYQSYEKYKI